MTIRHALRLLAERLFGESHVDPRGLLAPWFHDTLIEAQRAVLLISRVRLVAALFAFLTPLWILVDTLFLPLSIWPQLAAGRLAATVAFAILSLLYRKSDRLLHAYIALGALFLIPTLFFGYAHTLFAVHPHDPGTPLSVGLMAGYAFLPFVIAAGLSVFPLTALEGVVFALPVLAVQAVAARYGTPLFDGGIETGLLWLLCLLVGIAVLSGMSQLHYLSEIITKASHDALTDVFNRATGEELLQKYEAYARRHGTPLAVAFIDLDHFKSINDGFGHEAGDEVLYQAALRLQTSVRREDVVVRWGGEEFLVAMPHSTSESTVVALERLAAYGLGHRPDDRPVTASIGLAERLADNAADLGALIRAADERMYRAKTSGRNRLCYAAGGEEHIIGPLIAAGD